MTDRDLSILQLLQIHGFVSVSKLSKAQSVSQMTIRRDLKRLEEANQIRRVHGGAVPLVSADQEPVFSIRATSSVKEKRVIAGLGAELVSDGSTIALDVGSTALELAKLLLDRRLTIVTTNLHVMQLCLGHTNITVVCPGGVMRSFEGSFVGSLTLEALASFHVDQFFLGVGGLDTKSGLTEYSMEDAAVKRAMAANAKQVIGLVDVSKFNRTIFSRVGEVEMLDVLVTNATVPSSMRDVFERHDITIIEP